MIQLVDSEIVRAMPIRRNARGGRRGGIPARNTASPLSIIRSTSPKLWVDSQLGTGATSWADQSGGGNNFSEATNPPSLTALGGVPCYLFNGINQKFRSATLSITSGQWYWIIARQVSWVSNGSLCGSVASGLASVLGTGSTPENSFYCGGGIVAPNSGAIIGSWVRIQFRCSNSAGDYLRIGPTTATGNPGNASEVGWDIGCRAGAFFGNWAIASIVVTPAEPTALEKANLDAYGASRWTGVNF